MSQYKLIFTDVGVTKKQNAELNNSYINIEKFAVGSGTIVTLNSTMTGLIAEEYRTFISNMDTKNGVTYFDCIVPDTVGGFYIREIALIDDIGDVIAIGTVPETYKVNQAEGASKSVHLKLSTTSSNSDNITFLTDSSTVFATLQYVNDHINDLANPHQVTKSQVGLGNVDNTSDVNKPVSLAQQTELDLKINITDIKDTLTSVDTNKPLSANQGKVLKGLIDNINTILLSDDTTLDQMQELVNFIKQNKQTLDTLGISNIAGLQAALDGKLGVNANAVSSSKWVTARTLTLNGDVTGSVSIDGSGNVILTGTVVDDSHNHTIANVDGLQTTLNGKASVSHSHTAASIGASTFTVGQSWGSYSRALNTTYTNTTGKPIAVAVMVNGYYGDATLYVGSSVVNRTYSSDNNRPTHDGLFAIVPAGATYKVTTSGTYSLLTWSELR